MGGKLINCNNRGESAIGPGTEELRAQQRGHGGASTMTSILGSSVKVRRADVSV